MKSSGESLRPPGFDEFSKGKALVLLFFFHALRAPNDPSHHDTIFALDDPLLPDGVWNMPEEPLTDPALSLVAKATKIGEQFRGVFTSGDLPTSETESYGALVDVCEAARLWYATDDVLRDESGSPLSSQDLLPPPEVVQSMVEVYVLRRVPVGTMPVSEPLVNFISQFSDGAT